MIKAIAGGVFAALLMVSPALAQGDGIATRVSSQVGGKFQGADCQLKEGHFLISSAKTKVSSAASASDPVIATRLLREGTQIIQDATTTKAQDKNPAAWYWLGRIDLLLGDMAGADSSFTKAATGAPQCKADIQKYRTRAWSALVVGAQEFMEQKQTDSAVVLYRAANQINQDAPHGFNGLAGIFYDAGKVDSAIVYFGKSAATNPTDPTYIKVRNKAAFNVAVLLLNNNRPAESVAAFQRYLAIEPGDLAAKKGLAQAFRGAGMADSAQALERELVSSAGASEPGAAGDDAVSEADLMGIAVKQFNDKNYKEAAATFGKVLTINPNSRDALFNQANAYLALQQGPELSAAAEKLIALEPLAEYDYTMHAQGYKLAGNQDGLFKAIVAREGLPVNIEIESFKYSTDGATLGGKVTGREAKDENNKTIPARALTLVVEFLGTDGSVVVSQDFAVPLLKPADTIALKVEGKGAGVKSWRYRVK